MSVTAVFTSYNRFDLLVQTIDSFMNLNSYPLDRIILIEDSTDEKTRMELEDYLEDKDIDFIFNEENLGQPASIDKAYAEVESDYIFHGEDDYIFSGNSEFIQNSIDILEERSDVHQIWMRHMDDYVATHGIEGMFDEEMFVTESGVEYRMVSYPNPIGPWCGFSWNPGVRRTSDYRRLFPNGYQEYIQPEDPSFVAEFRCNYHALENGYRAALLVNGACQNVGQGLSMHHE